MEVIVFNLQGLVWPSQVIYVFVSFSCDKADLSLRRT